MARALRRFLVEKFVRAHGSGDIEALIALFTDDICVSMPPIPNEHHGRDATARLYTRLIRQGCTYDFFPRPSHRSDSTHRGQLSGR
jgi:hypothetical protein